MKSVGKTIEKDFSPFFRDPIAKLNRLNKEEANTQKEKKQLVIDVAMRLEHEEDVAVDNICRIIIKNLQVELKPRTIREYLPEKYKQLHKVNNAKKQKSKQPGPLATHNLAAEPPLNQEEVDYKETLLIDTKDKISIHGEEDIQPLSTTDISMINTDLVTSFEHHPTLNSDTPLLLPQQQEPIIATSITKCPECHKKDIIILELEEAIKNSSPFTTAEKLVAGKITDDNKEAVEDIIEVECYKIYRETSEYVGSFFHLGNNAKIYFTVIINATTRKLISFDFGKLDQYRNMDGN